MKEIFHTVSALTREHMVAIMLGAFVAMLVVSPHVRVIAMLGEEFRGVYPAFNDDEVYYQARIKEVIDGNAKISNPYLVEHVEDPFVMPPLGEWVMAGVANIAGISAPAATAAFDAILAFVNFLLLYILFLIVTQRRVVLSLLLTLSFFLLFLGTFGRPISPQLNTVLFFLGLIQIAKLFLTSVENEKRTVVSIGVITGVIAFVSPYYVTSLFVLFFSLLSLHTWYTRGWRKVRAYGMWFLLPFLPFVVFYIFLQVQAAQVSFYEESVARFGLMHTHYPGSFTNVLIGILVAAVVLFFRRFLGRSEWVWCLAMVLSIIALNWQNVITGKSLQFSSHYRYTTVLFSLLTFGILISRTSFTRTEMRNVFSRIGLSAIVVVFFCIAYLQKEEYLQFFAMPYTRTEMSALQKKMDVFDWLNTVTPKESVVYALGGYYDFLIPVYTHNKVYYNFYAGLYSVSNKETETRWLIQNFLNPQMSTTTMLEHQRDFWGNRFIDVYQSSQNRVKIASFLMREPYTAPPMVDDTYIQELNEKWESIRKNSFTEALHTYRVEYILLSSELSYFSEAKDILDATEGIVLKEEIGDIFVYTVDR